MLSISKAGGDLNKNLDNVYKRIKAIKAVLSFEFYLRKRGISAECKNPFLRGCTSFFSPFCSKKFNRGKGPY